MEALGRAGLIGQQPGRPAEFVHPLFRQALYEDLAGPVRTRLHARAFGLLHARGLDTQAAEHAVAAGLAGDLEAAGVLEAAGRAARRVGALATAVRWLDAAVAAAGQRASVALLLAQAETLLDSGRARVETLWMLGRALAMAGDHDPAAAAPGDPPHTAGTAGLGSAAEPELDAAAGCGLTAGPVQLPPVRNRAGELACSPSDQLPAAAEQDRAELALLCADPAGPTSAQQASTMAGRAPRRGNGHARTAA